MKKDDFTAAWDARDQLLEQLKRDNCVPLRTLYVREDDGSARCAGLLPGHEGMVLIDWQSDHYTLRQLREPELTAEPFSQKSDGFGGMFGFGEKGANGWLLRFSERGETVAEVALLPTITAFADLLVKDDKFLYGRRKTKQIPLWQLKPESSAFCENVVLLWEKLLRARE